MLTDQPSSTGGPVRESSGQPSVNLSSNAFGDSFDVDGLTDEQQIRLTHVLDEYLQSLERGETFDADAACRDEPALRRAVDVYLAKLNSLYGVSDSNQETSASIPEKLGAFTLVREIGRGGMGIVYEATQQDIDRSVALKLLPIAATFDAHQIARFKNESRAAGLLQHPNIVPVYCVGEAEGVHFYAMQLIVGTPIDQWIDDKWNASQKDADNWYAGQKETGNAIAHQESIDKPSADSSSTKSSADTHWETVVHWAIDIASALHLAHQSGVVHRDVKPSNLMIDQQNKIWIMDFGLARCQSNLSLTRPGDVVGTMRYMSPEQACGQSALVDARSDVYSLAVTVYEMLTLHPAHAGEDGPAILKAIDVHQVKPARRLCRGIPRDLETVIAKAMSKKRDARYETAIEFADDLRRVINREPTVARPPTVVDRVTRFAMRHQQAVMVAVLFCILGFIGFAISTAKIAASATRLAESEQLAHEAFDRLGSQTAELLKDLPAAQPVRRQLLRETISFYEQFAKRAHNNPSLRRDLANTHGKIGTFQSELGASDEAISALVQSEDLYAELAIESPMDVDAQLEWSVSQNNLAQSLHRAGRLEEAARLYAKAIHTQKDLCGTDQNVSPQNSSGFVRKLATTQNNLGLLLADTGASKEAEASYLAAIELLSTKNDSTSQPDPRSDDQMLLASVLANLSGLLCDSDPKRAVRYAADALANQTAVLESDRRNPKLATEVIVTLNTLGAAQTKNKECPAAVATLERAIEISEQMLLQWPDHASYQRDLVVSLNQLGLTQSRLGDLPKARSAFQRALQYQRPLTTQFSSDAETHSMLGSILNNLGFLHRQLGDDDLAANAYSEAAEQQKIATKLAPQVDRYRHYLEKHRHNLAVLGDSS